MVLKEESEVEQALDRGVEAVQLLHTNYSRLLAQLRDAREVRSDRTRVAFSVGTVFTHKKFGYKGKHSVCSIALAVEPLLEWSHVHMPGAAFRVHALTFT